MGRHRGLATWGIVLVLSGCAAPGPDKEPLRITPRSEMATSPVIRETLPQPAPAPGPAMPDTPAVPATAAAPASASPERGSAAPTLAHAAPAPSRPAPPAAVVPTRVPPGTLYVCTASVEGQVRQTAIEFEPRVRDLCAKHPEMGVCQYERDACRASGGRVHTVSGTEITRQTEAEYDKKVLRVRFRAG